MKKSLKVYLWSILGVVSLHADVTEMVLYPSDDFSSAIAHFYHQGDKTQSYGFVFDEGFDTQNILYAQPDGYTLKTRNDKKVQLVFDKTDRYSYMQRITKKDFIVGEEANRVKMLMSSGDCVSAPECKTKSTLLTALIPSGYKVIEYKGLDQDLKPLAHKEWKIKERAYTLLVSNVKGASLYMELEKTSNATPATPSSPLRTLVYENTELFEKGDVILSQKGLQELKTIAQKVGDSHKILIGVFQDRVPPKRLSHRYPTSEKFSKARAETLYSVLIKSRLRADQVRIEMVDKPNERTRVEMVITPVR